MKKPKHVDAMIF